MKACVYDRYGGPEVVTVGEVARPIPGPREVLVRVTAASVTTADWRFRASAFPGGFALAGRLLVGIRRPRHRVLGMDFAGEVAEVGSEVTRFRVGDRLFGSAARGAHAEYLAVPEDGAVTLTPDRLTDEEAAAVPFGANSALAFVRDVAKVQAGQRVLVVAASGGVGVWAVQLARHLGAEVTAVARADSHELLRSLGATHTIDYTRDPYLVAGANYDLIFDTFGATTFAQALPALAPTGTYMPLTAGFREIVQSITTRFGGGPRLLFHVSANTRGGIEENAALLASGALRPVVDQVYPMEQIAEAHRKVEGRHKRGAVVVRIAEGKRTSHIRAA